MDRETKRDSTPTLAEFQRLIEELLTGEHRSLFQRWEIELLLDTEESLREVRGAPKQLLRKYLRAVEKAWQDDATGPMKFSEYLARQPKRKPSQTVSARRKELSA